MSKTIKMDIPIALMAIIGIWMILENFIPFPDPLVTAAADLRTFASLISAGSVGVGTVILCLYHGKRVVQKKTGPHWSLSIIFFISLIVTIIPGMIGGTSQPQFNWIFENVWLALDLALYSLTAFYITSAGFRVFRARNFEASLLLISGVLVILGMTTMISSPFPIFSDIATWIQTVPGAAGYRGFNIGVALGVIGLGIRIFLGKQREVLR